MLPPPVDQTAGALAETRTIAEVLEAREIASFTYDPAKRTARLARAKGRMTTWCKRVPDAGGRPRD
jgi:hypothetical protein